MRLKLLLIWYKITKIMHFVKFTFNQSKHKTFSRANILYLGNEVIN